MSIKTIISSLTVMTLVCACQTEAPQKVTSTKQIISVRVSLPGGEDTRSHVSYGNQDREKEVFYWDNIEQTGAEGNDYIHVFNISRLDECQDGVQLDAVKVDGKEAIFEAVVDNRFNVKAGDLIFANYWETLRKTNDDGTYDDRNIFSIAVGSTNNKPQLVIENPEEQPMTWMQSNLKTYGMVIAEKDNEIPDIHFRHLSAIIRVSLRNKTGQPLFPKGLVFECPDSTAFFASQIYCSVDTTSIDGTGLKIYEIEDETYTDKVSMSINNYTGADGVLIKGGPIADGETYDLYLSCVPRIANTMKSKNLIITLEGRGSSSNFETYKWTYDNYNKTIEAGKRYWYKLTAYIDEETGERKLVLNSQWDKLQEEKNKDNGDQNSSGD